MDITIRKVVSSERPTLDNLYQFYVYEMACFFDKPVSADGRFDIRSEDLTPYWTSPNHWPYFIYKGSDLIGFCLLRYVTSPVSRFDVEQFFILRPYQGCGAGEQAFAQLIAQHPGRWQIRVMRNNISALTFWRRCVQRFSSEPAEEEDIIEVGLPLFRLYFHSSPD